MSTGNIDVVQYFHWYGTLINKTLPNWSLCVKKVADPCSKLWHKHFSFFTEFSFWFPVLLFPAALSPYTSPFPSDFGSLTLKRRGHTVCSDSKCACTWASCIFFCTVWNTILLCETFSQPCLTLWTDVLSCSNLYRGKGKRSTFSYFVYLFIYVLRDGRCRHSKEISPQSCSNNKQATATHGATPAS